jgi:hypothetical protein
MLSHQKAAPTKTERDAATRAAREAEALRTNLQRRKAQSRARKTQEPGKAPDNARDA